MTSGRALPGPPFFAHTTGPAGTVAAPVFALAIMDNFSTCGQ
jgi:hypothetical protein